MSRPNVLAAAALLGSLVACNPFAPGATRTIVVDHHPVECMGPWEQLCLLIEANVHPGFTRHYGGIEGFHYAWGYVYRLTVVDRRVRNPPADGSSTRTILQRVVSKERVPAGTEFDLILTTEGFGLEPTAQDRYRIYGEAEFICPPGADCDDLRSNVDAGARMRFRLEHPASPADPLVLREWEVCTGGSPGSDYLRHMLAEAAFLVAETRNLTRSQFLQDEVIRACVRSIEVIGEASNVPVRAGHDAIT